MTKLYLFANWKMYLSYEESAALARELARRAAGLPDHVKLAVFPNALSLPAVQQELQSTSIGVGAQNFYWVDKGGATGEISAEMFRAAGCRYALVGHSERRHLFKESNHDVRQKLEAALRAGLTPALCVGETLAERDAGETVEVLEAQLRAALMDITWPTDTELIVAYEPVWAVGTGQACEAPQAEKMAALIDKFIQGLVPSVQPVILYGGSVRGNNARAYFTLPHLQGVLVGGAATKLDSWLEIIQAAI